MTLAMALSTETPSRIWRRIKEDEAHDADMPSLPSLPAFDNSAVDEINTASFSLGGDASMPNSKPLATQHSLQYSPLALPQTAQFRVADNEPTVQPTRPSATSSCRNAAVIKGAGSGAHFLSRQSPSPIPSPLLDRPFEGDRNHVMRKAQDFDGSGSNDSFSNALNLCDFKEVAVRELQDPTRPPILSHSLLSSSPSISSLPKRSISCSPSRSSCQNLENSTSRESSAENILSLRTGDEERLVPTSANGPSAAEDTQNSCKTSKPRELTFSSEDAETTHVPGGRSVHFPLPMSFPSTMSTPALAHQSRGSLSFSGGCVEDCQADQKETDDMATPLPRRKSFLLSVVNSTARPRLTFPTPRPRVHLQTANNAATGLTPGSSRPFKLGGRRGRLSHPLSQISTFVPSTPQDAPVEADHSPEGAASVSFVSTASSHDLTVYHRANASFDPLTGPQGVGRFNAGKLNTYLHGLNRRLQEENELLVNRVRSQQLELEVLHNQVLHRELSGVMEDEAAEQWVLEKESLEQKVVELGQTLKARDKELADEQAERMRDKERWKERMTEVEDGVGKIVSDLEKRLQEAETKVTALKDVELHLQDAQLRLSSATDECQLLKHRADQAAEQIVANEREAGSALRSANDLTNRLEQDIQNLARQLSSLQALLVEKEEEATSLKSVIRDLNQNPARKAIEKAEESRIILLEKENEELMNQLRSTHGLSHCVNPFPNASMSGLSPRQLINLSMRAPRTPGGPLRNASWLMNMTGDTSTGHLMEEIGRLQKELDIANESIDDKLDKLEEAGLGVVGLTKALEDARRRIMSLESQFEEQEARCQGCNLSHSDYFQHASDLANKHANLKISYDERRRQLDLQAKEIETLRAAFSSQVETLNQICTEKKHGQAEDLDVQALALKLQFELERLQQEADRLGHDLVQLRAERDEMVIHHQEELAQHERASRQDRAQLRALKEQFTTLRESREITSEIDAATESLRLKHNKECKGLFVQIRYLKAKFTREAALRDDLGYQKGYLLVLLSQFEKSEKRILATIAQIGPIASPMPCPRFKSLRAVALAVVFISRARLTSEAWREQRLACSAIAAALDSVKRDRLLKA